MNLFVTGRAAGVMPVRDTGIRYLALTGAHLDCRVFGPAMTH